MNTAPVVYDQNSTLFGHGLFGDCYLNIVDTAATMLFSTQYQPVFMSVIGSIIVGLSGLFPLLILPVDDSMSLKTGREYSCPTIYLNKVNKNVHYCKIIVLCLFGSFSSYIVIVMS